MDISHTLAPDSDQLDAVDLLSGPQVFTIESVSKGDPEQPVQIHLADFPRPWRPGKSMRRVLAACWGTDAAKWSGHRVELYCDPAVSFGGLAVGGTRISRLSHLDKRKLVPLLISRGKSAMFPVQPLPDATESGPVVPASAQPDVAHGRRRTEMLMMLGRSGRKGQAAADFITAVCERPVTSPAELTAAEIESVVKALQPDAEPDPEPPADDDERLDPAGPMTPAQRGKMFAQFDEMGIGDETDAEIQRNWISDVLGHECKSRKDLTMADGIKVIEAQIATLDQAAQS